MKSAAAPREAGQTGLVGGGLVKGSANGDTQLTPRACAETAGEHRITCGVCDRTAGEQRLTAE